MQFCLIFKCCFTSTQLSIKPREIDRKNSGSSHWFSLIAYLLSFCQENDLTTSVSVAERTNFVEEQAGRQHDVLKQTMSCRDHRFANGDKQIVLLKKGFRHICLETWWVQLNQRVTFIDKVHKVVRKSFQHKMNYREWEDRTKHH